MATIRIWVYDGILASGVAGPIDVFHAANKVQAKLGLTGGAASPLFSWSVESVDGRDVRAASGQMIAVDAKIDSNRRSDAVIVTAPYHSEMDGFLSDRELLGTLSTALQRQHRAGALLAGYCTANYVLAEAGLLDDRIATTHWAKVKDFAKRYPRVQLRAQEVLTEQDGIISSGAVTSYLNLAVRLVHILGGEKIATTTAKLLLIDINRISQASYATLVEEHGHSDPLVAKAQQRMEASLQHKFQLNVLADHLAVSERTLNRRFKQALGVAPLEYLQNLRIEVAKRMLESRPVSLADVSQRVGYADLSTFRRLFKKKTGLSPHEYQVRFSRTYVENSADEQSLETIG